MSVTGVDALQIVKASLPFRERRGLVLVDPAYEVPDEAEKTVRIVAQALRRMAAVTLLVWYPVTSREFADSFCKGIAELGMPGLLQVEVMVREPFREAGLAGSGVLCINPPWTLHDEMQVLAPFLAKRLGTGKWGRSSVNWLTPPL